MIEWRTVRGVRVAVIENVLVVDLPGTRAEGGDLRRPGAGPLRNGGNSRARTYRARGAAKGDSGRVASLNEPETFGAPDRRGGNRTRRPVDQVLKRSPEDLDEL